MPYIKCRKAISKKVDSIETLLRPAGELNFIITKLIHNWLKRNGLNYTHLNTVIGVLECVKLELYRQIAAPYEDTKKKEHGSVSELDKEEKDEQG